MEQKQMKGVDGVQMKMSIATIDIYLEDLNLWRQSYLAWFNNLRQIYIGIYSGKTGRRKRR